MARELVIAWVGKRRSDDWEALCSEYRGRISQFSPIRELPVRVKGSGGDLARLRVEARALESALPAPAWRVAMDRRGKGLSSEKLAVWLQRRLEQSPHPIVFILGSDLGLDPGLKETCNEVISMGPMTLPHELAKLVLLEQIYRAFTIGAGIKYHRSAF